MRNQSEPSNFAAIKTPISQEALDQLFCEAREWMSPPRPGLEPAAFRVTDIGSDLLRI